MKNQSLIEHYENLSLEFDTIYSGSEFMNYGYWDENTKTPVEASKNLVHFMVKYFGNYKGTLLNVACGNGSETQILAQYFAPSNITSINISKPQLERAARKLPEVQFIQMNATDLQFESNYFDNIICIEAAFHFNTRQKFLSESFRVLKPGGQIILTDLLFKSNLLPNNKFIPRENYLRHLKDYEEVLSKIGYSNIKILDVTNSTFKPWKSYVSLNFLKHYPTKIIQFIRGAIGSFNIRSCIFIVAEKPPNFSKSSYHSCDRA